MIKYIIKRLLLIPVLVVATTMVIFFLVNLTPDDPAILLLPDSYTQEELEAKHVELGMDQPLPVQYVNWLVNACRGDFGISYSQHIPVWDAIKGRIPLSLALAFLGTLVIAALGIPIGVICAVNQYKPADSILNVLAKFVSAFPNFWLAMLLVMLFSVKLGWLPSFGYDGPKYWIMPIIALALPDLGGYVRQTRSCMLDCINQDYVRTARSKGARERQVIYREAFRNAMLPLLTSTGQRFAMLLGGATVVESCFAFPGLGSLLISAITVKDINIIMAGSAILSACFIVVMLLVDIAIAFVDPRTKSTFLKKSR